MKHEAFVSGMAMLATGLPPRKPLEDAALELYWIGLKDLTDEEFSRAVARASRESTFLPAPAELRAFVKPPRDLVHEAEVAWDAVREAIDRIDYTVSEIDFGAAVNACIRQLGGWDALCRAKLPELDVWKRKEFLRLYVEVFGDKPTGDVGRPLEGPLDGRVYPARMVAIPGLPTQPLPPALEPIGGRGEVADLVSELAKAKALP